MKENKEEYEIKFDDKSIIKCKSYQMKTKVDDNMWCFFNMPSECQGNMKLQDEWNRLYLGCNEEGRKKIRDEFKENWTKHE